MLVIFFLFKIMVSQFFHCGNSFHWKNLFFDFFRKNLMVKKGYFLIKYIENMPISSVLYVLENASNFYSCEKIMLLLNCLLSPIGISHSTKKQFCILPRTPLDVTLGVQRTVMSVKVKN